MESKLQSLAEKSYNDGPAWVTPPNIPAYKAYICFIRVGLYWTVADIDADLVNIVDDKIAFIKEEIRPSLEALEKISAQEE